VNEIKRTTKDLSQCKGCLAAYDGRFSIKDCIIVKYGNIDNCPCKDCLVKVVCKGKCDEITKYLIKVVDSDRYKNR
jgi:hypothetical protein